MNLERGASHEYVSLPATILYAVATKMFMNHRSTINTQGDRRSSFMLVQCKRGGQSRRKFDTSKYEISASQSCTYCRSGLLEYLKGVDGLRAQARHKLNCDVWANGCNFLD